MQGLVDWHASFHKYLCTTICRYLNVMTYSYIVDNLGQLFLKFLHIAEVAVVEGKVVSFAAFGQAPSFSFVLRKSPT